MGIIKQALVILILAFVLQKIPSYFEPKLPPVVEGFFRPEFRKVAETFRSFIENGKLKGGSFAVFHKGEVIVELWGGYADIEAQSPWRNDTITLVYSSTKGLVSILAGLFVERGWLDYDKPVADYWPEFGVNGKDEITVKLLLSHQAGLSIINGTLSVDVVKNHPAEKEKILEQQTPYWPPGTVLAYHGITFGLYVDTLLQKADPKKRRIDQIFREEIAQPYDIDFMIGAPVQEHYRVARNYPVSAWNLFIGLLGQIRNWWMIKQFFNPNSPMMLALNVMPEMGKSHLFNNPVMRTLPLSSNLGFGNARAVAKLYGIVANKGMLGDKKIFSDKVLKLLTSEVVTKVTKDMGIELSLGHGLFLQKNAKEQTIYGSPGYGGQMAFIDVTNNIGMAYYTNHLSPYSFGDDPNFIELQKTFYDCYDKFNV